MDPAKLQVMLEKAQAELALSKRAVADMEAALAEAAAAAEAEAAKAKAAFAAEKLAYQEELAAKLEQQHDAQAAAAADGTSELEAENGRLKRRVDELLAELAEEKQRARGCARASRTPTRSRSTSRRPTCSSRRSSTPPSSRARRWRRRSRPRRRSSRRAAGSRRSCAPSLSSRRLAAAWRRRSASRPCAASRRSRARAAAGGGGGGSDEDDSDEEDKDGAPGGEGEATDGASADGAADERAAREARYHQFVAMAHARKLALAAHGYEVENVFVDQLFDDAERAGVPPDRWHEFLREEFPAPDMEEEGALPDAEAFSPPAGLKIPAADKGWKRVRIAHSLDAFHAERRDRRERGALPSPRMRRVSIVPDAADAERPAGASSLSDMRSRLSIKRALGESFASIDEQGEALDEGAWEEELTGEKGAAARGAGDGGDDSAGGDGGDGGDGGGNGVRGRGGGGSAAGSSPGGARARPPPLRRRRTIVRAMGLLVGSSDLPKVLLALTALAVLFFLRARRLGPRANRRDVLGVEHLLDAIGVSSVDDAIASAEVLEESALAESAGACRFDWRVGCVEAAAGVLAQTAVCALRPYWVGLRCIPVHIDKGADKARAAAKAAWGAAAAAAAASVRGQCPSHCQPEAYCRAQAAQLLHRVAHGLRTECVFDGTCPLVGVGDES